MIRVMEKRASNFTVETFFKILQIIIIIIITIIIIIIIIQIIKRSKENFLMESEEKKKIISKCIHIFLSCFIKFGDMKQYKL